MSEDKFFGLCVTSGKEDQAQITLGSNELLIINHISLSDPRPGQSTVVVSVEAPAPTTRDQEGSRERVQLGTLTASAQVINPPEPLVFEAVPKFILEGEGTINVVGIIQKKEEEDNEGRDEGEKQEGEEPPVEAKEESSNFVFVTQPLPSVSQFTEWVNQQCLPDAQTLMKGRKLKEDEVELFLDRQSFIRDLVKTFVKKNSMTNAEIMAAREEDAKNQQQEQGTAAAGGDDQSAAAATSSSTAGGAPEDPLTMGKREASLTEESTEQESLASLDHPKTWERVWKQFAVDLPRQHLEVEGVEGPVTVDEAYGIIMEFLQSLPPNIQEKISKFGQPDKTSKAASILSTLFTPFAYVAGAVVSASPLGGKKHSEETPSDKDQPDTSVSSKSLEGLQRLERFICLLCQQSVLAVPFEIIATQYMTSSNPENPLFVGEVSASNATNEEATMRIFIRRRGGEGKEASMPVVQIEKLFRVFALLEDEGDMTLFHVASTLTVDLLAPQDEPLVMQWRIQDVSGKNIPGAAGATGRDHRPERKCECLGATSGYHKDGCLKKRR